MTLVDQTDDKSVDLIDLVRALYERSRDAVLVPPHEFISEGTENRCHDNVDRWVAAHNGTRKAVGWTVLDYECEGPVSVVCFVAHSVLREADGSLAELTPAKHPMPFLEHHGDPAAFDELVNARRIAVIDYYPQTNRGALRRIDDPMGGGFRF